MKALDIHCHMSTEPFNAALRTFNQAIEKYYRVKTKILTEDEMAEELREVDVKALIIAWDAETSTGLPRISHEYVAGLISRYPDVMIGGWACVDPWKGEWAINEAERAVKEFGMIGLKFQGVAQAFFPNDTRFYPLYEKAVELKVPIQFHTGTTGLGAGMPGGMGRKLKYTQPIHLDDVAADFPELTIIACHPSWPWQSEMIAILLHKANVYMETSGWSPKYFTPELKKEINGRLQDKVMFGSDYPVLPFKRLFDDWETEGYKADVLEKIFYKNAQRILNIKI